MRRDLFVIATVVTLVLAAPLAAAAAVVLAQVPGGQPQQAADEDEVLQQLEDLFVRAEAMFNSADQDRSVRMFTDLIDLIERRGAAQGLDPEIQDVLLRSVAYRAEAHFNFGQSEQADADMRKLISIQSGYEFDAGRVSPRLAERLEELREVMVGQLDVILTPSNATLLVEGIQVQPSLGPISVLAGPRELTASLPGHTEYRELIEIAAGETLSVEVVLERVTAVVKLVTRPVGAEVTVDGQAVGTTSGEAPLEFFPIGDAAQYPVREFSDYLSFEVLPGEHTIGITLDGYRPVSVRMEVPDLRDYEADPVVLEPTRGTVRLTGVPEGAEIRVDEEPVQPGEGTPDSPELTMPPGEHTVVVEHPTDGFFEGTVVVEDSVTLTIPVALLPVANFVGVLGEDDVASERLMSALSSSFATEQAWLLRDRSEAASPVLETVASAIAVLREMAAEGTSDDSAIDWSAFQARFDESVPGSIYLLAVLSDDLMATHVDVWIWPSAPGPARPDRFRVSVDDAAALAALATRLNPPGFTTSPWWGGLVVDNPVRNVPTVIEVTPGSPAAAAGLMTGDEILAINGQAVALAGTVRDAVASSRSGDSMTVEIRRGEANQTVAVPIEGGPAVLTPEDTSVAASAVWVAAQRGLELGDSGVPDWVLNLNAAVAQMRVRDWVGAVRTLRQVDAPENDGLGRAAVDYWLGVSLLGAGPEYTENAREAFRRAAESENGRLFHNDGPFVAPRARARLAALGEISG